METRLLRKNEINKFKKLVHFNYKKNHILSQSSRLINFYYNYYNKNKLNIVGLFNEKKELIAALGFVPYKNWDRNLNNDCHIAFWVKKKKSTSSLELMQFLLRKINPLFLASSGINKKTSGKIFQKFGLIKNFFNYYIKNEHIISKISKNLSNNFKENFKKKELDMVCSKSVACIPRTLAKPEKSLLYFKNKYFKNPFYNYYSMQFFEKKKLKFFFIYRIIKVRKLNSTIVRIVDFYGKIRQDHSVFLSIQKFLKKNKFEYIDFVNVGLDKELKNAGFTKKKKYNLIPDLFEPYFEKSTQRNYCILKNNYKKNIILVKSDGDGDRPNLL
jgi:hypothetical protein